MNKCNGGLSGLWHKTRHSFFVASRKYFSFLEFSNTRLALVVVALTLAACSGGGGGGGNGEGSGVGSGSSSQNFVVSGTVSAPGGAVAFLPRKNLFEQFADALITPVYAAVSGSMPVADGSTVQLVRIHDDGTVANVIASAATSGGRYSFDLTALGISTANDLIVQILDTSGIARMRAFVVSANVDIDPVSEVAARIVLEQAATSSLDNFTTQELADIYSALYLFVMTQSMSNGPDIESTVSAFKNAVLADSNIASFITATAGAGQTAQGPGDIGNYFPFDDGSTWIYQGSEQSGGRTTNYTSTVQINGTHVTGNGITTTIFHETNSANPAITEEDYFVKNSQAITNYGTNDVSDFLIPQIVPYREYIFPLGLNSSFEAINKSGLSWPDEDWDGIPETASLNASVTVVGFEDITVPAGTYTNAAKIVANVNISVILSDDGATVIETITSTEWYTPGVGLVKSIDAMEITAYGVTDISTVTEVLSQFSKPPKPLVLASISVGLNHSCGLMPEGKAYCWGSDSSGQLGIGKAVCNSTPENPCPPIPPGGDPHPYPIAVTGGLTFTSLALSAGISCGIANTGALYCWGAYGMTEDYGTFSSGTPVLDAGNLKFTSFSVFRGPFGYVKCGIVIGDTAYCWGENSDGQLGKGFWYGVYLSPSPVSGGHLFSAVNVGERHVCALSINGTAYCWGDNYYGELGDGTRNSSSIPVSANGNLTFASMNVGGNFSCGKTLNGDTYSGCAGPRYNATGLPSPSRVLGHGAFVLLRRPRPSCG